MITMNPVDLHGLASWDQAFFPLDENEERVWLVRAEMARRGLQALVVFGHYTRYEDLCYLSQFVPIHMWGLVVVPAEGDPVLVLGHGGSRDIPVTRNRTWIVDIRALPTLGGGLRALLADLHIEGQIGLIGAEHSLPAALHDEVLAALGEGRYVRADDLISGLRRALRPREISAVRQAARIVQEAAAAFAERINRDMGVRDAMVEADGTARRLGAADFRGLANVGNGGQLEPVEEPVPISGGPIRAYLAASYLGYWADLAITLGESNAPAQEAARRALQAMVEGARAGVRAGDLAKRAMDSLGPEYRGEALRHGLGGAVGLSLWEAPRVTPESSESLVENSILSLRVRLDGRDGQGALASELVLVKATGCESVLPQGGRQALIR